MTRAAPGLTFDALAPEFRLFCLAVRQTRPDGDREALRQALAAGPNWQLIVEAGRRHTVEALLLRGLRWGELPPHVGAV